MRRIEHLHKELVRVVDERDSPDRREKRSGRQGVEVVCVHGRGMQAQDLEKPPQVVVEKDPRFDQLLAEGD